MNCNRDRFGSFARGCAGATMLLASLAVAQTDAVNLTLLEGQSPVAPDAITAHGPDLFGDRVNLFNGALEFEHTDLSLPGNSNLPVALVRSYRPGRSPFGPGQFGDWDLEVPRVGGTFSDQYGWVTANNNGTNRCTGYNLPPGLNGFIATDYWRGTRIYVPGHGADEVLLRNASFTAAPTDGGSYPLVTHRNWQISCLPTIQNGAGDGFMAVSPEGVRYRFDWMAYISQLSVKKSGRVAGRNDIFLMATQVSDRFGNWVRYTYDSANPALLTRIESNDGRVITVTSAGGRAVSASDGTRTYTYTYSSQATLKTVLQPDGSQWSFNLAPMTDPQNYLVGEGANCDYPGDLYADPLVGTITHPSGAVGTFTTMFTLLGRTQVQRVCNYVPFSNTLTTGAVWPRYYVSQVLTGKQITGSGVSAMQWSYTYNAPGGWTTCTTPACTQGIRTVTVTDPAGVQTRHLFGSRWRNNEGKLLQVDEAWNGSSAQKTTTFQYRLPAGQPYLEQFGSSLLRDSDWLSTRHWPQDRRVTTLQGATFTWQANTFDPFVRALSVTKFGSLGYSRSETTAYSDNTTRWVLGQVASVTDGSGLVVQSHVYDTATANRIASSAFGRPPDRYDYYSNGLLNVHYDAANRPTTFSGFMRGVPQLVSYADGTAKSVVVNNLGLVTSRTNEFGTTTLYGHDTMGRVASITYPNEPDLAYHPTLLVFEQVNASEYGIAADHWRQTVSTGSARTIRYFDALWRERLKHTSDVSNAAATSSIVETRWNHRGSKTFASYAQRSLVSVDAANAGTAWAHDALGRVFRQYQDSELGVLTTSTDYLDGFQKRVTNARGYATTFAFQAFDSPSEDAITQVWAPEGVSIAIERDVFDKPTRITRSGAGLSATHSYFYDVYQRLCKTIEPESAATVQDFDTAGNIAWRASGLALYGASCEQASVLPPGRMLSYGYDLRNRLTSTSYGDASAGIGRSYTPDGLPDQVWSAGSTWTYGYNNRRLLTAETLNFMGGSFAFNRIADAYGNTSALTYPGNLTVAYSPNALGQATQVSGYATVAYSPNALGQATQASGYASAVTYHPNGAIAGYNLKNGIAHSSTQYLRGLPQLWRDAGMVQDLYAYDANANVTAITDQQEGVSSRAMGYDGLDRLTAANGNWGAGSFGYDALDNLRTSTVGSRSAVATIDAANRLSALNINGAVQAFGYDANGNLTQRGAQAFGFDIGNRLTSAPGKASYIYDGHGRRSWVAYADGSWKLQVYSQSGKLLYSQHSSQGGTWHIYLGERLIAENYTTTGVPTYLHTDALGSPVARTNASGQIISRTRYEPYGATAAGTNPTGIGFTGHVNDADTGLVYMQQRYYEPIAGRFLSVDPVTTSDKDGSFFGRYHYANNNPYKFKDPNGTAPILIPEEVGGRMPLIGGRNLDGTPYKLSIGEAGANLRAAREQLAAKGEKTFQTYAKTNAKTSEVYCGRTSGCGTALENLANRDASHHMNDKGFGPAVLDKSSGNAAAIRGREQQLIDANGGARSAGGTAGNAINGISPANPNRGTYLDAAKKEFSQ